MTSENEYSGRLLSFFQKLTCSLTGRRCLFCDMEVCSVWPNGNPFIGSEYRKAMEGAIKKGYRP